MIRTLDPSGPSGLARLVSHALLSVFLLALAGCPPATTAVVPPPVPAPLPVDNAELEAVLSVPHQGEVGVARTITLRFAWIGPAAPAEVSWELAIVAEKPDGEPGAAVRTLRGTTPLVAAAPIDLPVAWDGKDDAGTDAPAGPYDAQLVARAGTSEKHASRPLLVGMARTLPLPSSASKKPPAVSFGKAAPGGLPYVIVSGNLHSQSNHSDGGGDVTSCTHAEKPRAGAGDPNAAFEFARTRAKVDFLLLSEHNHMYDGDSNSVSPRATPAEVRALFDSGRAIAAAYRKAHPGFLALYGTEYGVVVGGGHVNLINPTGLVNWERTAGGELLGHQLVERSDYRALYALMQQQGWIGQFNHPDPDNFAAASEGMAYDAAGDEVMCLAEIANSPAFSARTDEGDPDINLFDRGFNRLLLRGYHVAPASNQDNHCANWGAAARNRTAVLLPTGSKLDEKSLPKAFEDALRARRTCATTDKTAVAILEVDGHMMGERFRQSGGPIKVKVTYGSESGEGISAIDLLVGSPGGPKVTPRKADRPEVTLPAFAPGDYFLFARVRQPDGDQLWTAPVWFTVGGPAATSK